MSALANAPFLVLPLASRIDEGFFLKSMITEIAMQLHYQCNMLTLQRRFDVRKHFDIVWCAEGVHIGRNVDIVRGQDVCLEVVDAGDILTGRIVGSDGVDVAGVWRER